MVSAHFTHSATKKKNAGALQSVQNIRQSSPLANKYRKRETSNTLVQAEISKVTNSWN
jgi:hypothetical protein